MDRLINKQAEDSLSTRDTGGNINTEYQYHDHMILKVWDNFISEKRLEFYIGKDRDDSGERYEASLFQGNDEMGLAIKAGLLVNNGREIYRNLGGYSVSMCQAVDYVDNSEATGENSISSSVKDSLNQINLWNQRRQNQITKHKILFPYHSGPNHWVLGVITLEYEQGILKDGQLEIYDPMGAASICESVKSELEKVLNDNGGHIELMFTGESKKQQNDRTSCGAITAENGKDIIEGKLDRLEKTYGSGAYELRKQHVEEANNARFTEIQRDNKVYSDDSQELKWKDNAYDNLEYLAKKKNLFDPSNEQLPDQSEGAKDTEKEDESLGNLKKKIEDRPGKSLHFANVFAGSAKKSEASRHQRKRKKPSSDEGNGLHRYDLRERKKCSSQYDNLEYLAKKKNLFDPSNEQLPDQSEGAKDTEKEDESLGNLKKKIEDRPGKSLHFANVFAGSAKKSEASRHQRKRKKPSSDEGNGLHRYDLRERKKCSSQKGEKPAANQNFHVGRGKGIYDVRSHTQNDHDEVFQGVLLDIGKNGIKLNTEMLKLLLEKVDDKLKGKIKAYIDSAESNQGVIKPTYDITKLGAVVTKDPNIQNIPCRGEEAYHIREAFTAREGHQFISCDYVQMELRIIAKIAGIKGFEDAFKSEKDIYEINSRKFFGLPDGAKVDEQSRHNAKTLVLGIIYGMTPFGLAERLGRSIPEVKELIESFFSSYEEIKDYRREVLTDARALGYVKTAFGRRYDLPYIASKIPDIKEHERRRAVNLPIQGTRADIMKLAMIGLHTKLKKEDGKMILPVHDELIVEAKDGKVGEVEKLMKRVMMDAAEEVLKTPIPVNTKTGNDFNFGKSFDKNHQNIELDDLMTDNLEKVQFKESELNNTPFDITGILYQIGVLILCAYRAFDIHKEKYKDLKMSTEGSQELHGKCDDLIIDHQDKTINVQIKSTIKEPVYSAIGSAKLFPEGKRRKNAPFSIFKYFSSFCEVGNELRDRIKYNILYTNEVLSDDIGENLFDELSIGEETQVLFDLFYASDKKSKFYVFSKNSREKLLSLLDPISAKTRMKILQELEHFPQIRDELKKLLKHFSKCKKEKVKSLLFGLKKSVEKRLLELLEPIFFFEEQYSEGEFKKLQERFLDTFVLAVGQPNIEELRELIKIDQDNYSKFRKKFLCWLKYYEGCKGYYLTKQIYLNWSETNASEQAKEYYRKSHWIADKVPAIESRLKLLIFLIHRLFKVGRASDYGVLSINFGRHWSGEDNHVLLSYGDKRKGEKCICISFQHGIEFDDDQKILGFLEGQFEFFLKLVEREKKEVEYFVISASDDIVECKRLKGRGMDLKILKDFLSQGPNDRYYQFTEEEEKLLGQEDSLIAKYGKKELVREFKKKLVFKSHNKDLESIIKNEGGDYCECEEVMLRWLESFEGTSLDIKKAESYLERIKNKENTQSTYKTAGEDIKQISSFAKLVVDQQGVRVFKIFKGFLCSEGIDKFKILSSSDIYREVSSILRKIGTDPIKIFNTLYGKLFSEDGQEGEFLKKLKKVGISLGDISGMLHTAGAEAPEALEGLYNKLIGGQIIHNGKCITRLEFLKDAGIMGSVSSMLSGSGKEAPEALEDMITTLTKIIKIEGEKVKINGKYTTYLKFLKDAGIMSNVSSMLSRSGKKAPEALEVLCKKLIGKEILHRKKNITYLKFLKENGIVSNVSDMLHAAEANAPEALEVLCKKLINGQILHNEEHITYLKFLKDNGIISNVPNMLHAAEANAPEALEELIIALASPVQINGKKTTCLKFLKDKGILKVAFSMLGKVKSRGFGALATLCCEFGKKVPGKRETYVEAFYRRGILHGNILNGYEGQEDFENFFRSKKINDEIKNKKCSLWKGRYSSIVQSLCKSLISHNKHIWLFFVQNNIVTNVTSMLDDRNYCEGKKQPMPLQGINDLFRQLCKEKIKGVSCLQFLKNEGIVSNVSSMLHAAGAEAPKALEDVITTLTKIIKINEEDTTYLKFLKDKGIMSNVFSMLSGAEAPEALEVLCKKLIDGQILHNGEHITYLEFLKDAGIMGNVSSMLSGSGKKAPGALEDMITTLTKIIKINGENTTYLKFLKDKGIMINISSVLHKVGEKAPKALERLVNTLVKPVTIREEEITYLESLRRYGVQYKVFSELRGKYLKSADFLDILLDQLNAKVENGQKTYSEFFADHEVLSDVIVENLLVFQGLKQRMDLESKEGLKKRLEGVVKDFFSTASKGLVDSETWKKIAEDSKSAFLNKGSEGLRKSERIQKKGNNSNVRSSESELPGKTDSQPRTCLNDPAVDSQLQRYSSFHRSPDVTR